MRKHPMAGLAVKIEAGPLKGKYFKVIDFLVTQLQGKAIENIAKSHGNLVNPVLARGHKLDDDIVFGRLYPSMEFLCVHDSELVAEQPKLQVIEGGQDDSGGSDQRDSSVTSAGAAEPDGRSVPSPKLQLKDGGKSKRTSKKGGPTAS